MTDQELADLMALGQHIENRNRFPAEELEKYRGQYIAWSLDGTRIIAHADDPDTLDERIVQAGEDLRRCVLSSLPEEDTVFSWSAFAPPKKPQRLKEADSH